MTEHRFGEVLRDYRVAKGLTQEALAERAGMSTRGISDLERGVHSLPRQDTLRLLLNALALTPADRAVLEAAAPRASPSRARRASRDASGLPAPLTSFVGREQEIVAVTALLRAPTTRLLTLTGPGGVGKTRLALAAAAHVAPQFPDGVVFVELAPLSDPALVISTIAERLGVRERAGQSLRDVLVAHLVGKRLLLILDNVEHVRPGALFITDILVACPALRVLATSRVALHLTGEHLYAVPSLAMPAAGPLPPLEDLGRVAAVHLFVERLQAMKPDFTLVAANAPAVVEIVRRLDGLPLALELVAVRARVLPPVALLPRLDRSLSLLTEGAQDMPPRQRTLRETIAWSYDLLRAEEQVLFLRLGVFAGGCTLEAAGFVANAGGHLDVLEGMTALLDASLVQTEVQGDASRFTMLATIREFAVERLMASGEELEARAQHARFFLGLLEQHDPEYSDPAWLDVIDREYDNLRAALEWARDTGEHDTLVRLAGRLVVFWYYRRHLDEGRNWQDRALETPPDLASPRPRATLLTWSGMLANVSGDSERAAALLTASFTWWERAGDAYGEMMARSLLGGVRIAQGRYDDGAALFRANEAYLTANEAALFASGHGDWHAHARFHLGLIAWMQGDDASAHRLLRESVEFWDRCSAPVDAVDPLRYLGLLACAAGDLEAAARWFREEWMRLRQYGSRAALAVGLADVATLAAARGEWQRAERLFARAWALAQSEAAAFSLPARDHYEQARARAIAALSGAAQAVTTSGLALTLEQVLGEAETVLALDQDSGGDQTPQRALP